jgi:hypothetical protein
VSKRVADSSSFELIPEDIPATVRKSIYAEKIAEFEASEYRTVRVQLPPDMKISTAVQGLRKAVGVKPMKVRQKQNDVYLEKLQGE